MDKEVKQAIKELGIRLNRLEEEVKKRDKARSDDIHITILKQLEVETNLKNLRQKLNL